MKRFLGILLAVLLLFSMISNASAKSAGFTHPEIGELIELGFNHDMPFFAIYGFTQYMVMDPDATYRGMHTNHIDLINKDMIGLDDSLKLFFDSIGGKSKEPVPLVFEYEGNLKDYSYELSALPVSERIKAIKLLSGFEGVSGYKQLSKLAGFESIDISSMEAGHVDYTVDIDGKSYPYRVLMFYFEEDDWEQIFYERYCYIKVNNEWKLGRIAKEYYSDYSQRVQYIHGMTGAKTDTLQNAYSEVFRGNNWHMTPNEIAAQENVKKHDNEISINDVLLFRIPASVTYNFTDDWLSSIEYEMSNVQSYYSAFVSLYIRFYDPITINSNGDMSWSLPDSLITLKYDDESPTITVVPRTEQQDTSVGKLVIMNTLS